MKIVNEDESPIVFGNNLHRRCNIHFHLTNLFPAIMDVEIKGQFLPSIHYPARIL
jgi:hypothetical protein